MLTLPIVVGKKYVRRDGIVVEAKEAHADISANCVYVGREEEAICEGLTHAYIDTGKIWAGERGGEDSNDLVADYIESHEIKSREQKSADYINAYLNEASGSRILEADPNGLHPNSPGAKLDAGKVRPSLVLGGFARALWEVSKVGTYGATKYTDNGWMEVADGDKRYDDAKMRHWLKEKMGEKCDKDTNLTHLAHEAWNALARLDLHIRETENEQRK